ncbi:MAG TPA: FAD-dependent oxidoreductase [Gaiellaceae bacterium]
MRATVKETREVAKGTRLVVFDLNGEHWDYHPGQYFWVELDNVGLDDEKGLRRHISIVTSPTEHGVMGLCTRLRDTAFKQTLARLAVGDEAEVEEPKGDYALPGDTSRPYVFVAGGIGITVFRSMLRWIADTSQPYRITLVYSNRDRESTAFLDELQELEQAIPGFKTVLTMTDDDGWDGESRRVDADFLREHLGDLAEATYLVAGPPGMVEAVAEQLAEAGVPDEQVLPSRFAGY